MRKRTPTFRKRPCKARNDPHPSSYRTHLSELQFLYLGLLYDELPRPDVQPVQKVYSPRMPSVTIDSVLDRFRRVGALLEGHFRLTSGLHSPGYLQCALVLQHPREAEACGAGIADKFGI